VNVLAIRLARFGDVVLLLPALSYLKAHIPECRLTFVTGQPCVSLAQMCPAIDEIIPVDRAAMKERPVRQALAAIGRLVRDVRRRNFDLAIDFHGLRETSLLAWLSGARQRLGLKRFDQSFLGICFNLPPVLEDKGVHVSEMFLRVAQRFPPRAPSVSPALVVPKEARRWASETLPARPFAALYVDAPVPERIWPPERFAAVAGHIVRHWDAAVVVMAGPGGGTLVEKVLEGAGRADRIHGLSNVTVFQLAAAIAASDLLISNDTGPMHLGPALGVRTLGIFSVGFPEHFRPNGIHDRFVRGNPVENVRVEDVLKVVEEIWPTVRRDLQR